MKKSVTIQVATLKAVMGMECKQVFKQLSLTPEELLKTLTILDRLEKPLAPERNILYKQSQCLRKRSKRTQQAKQVA